MYLQAQCIEIPSLRYIVTFTAALRSLAGLECSLYMKDSRVSDVDADVASSPNNNM
jgi:hypothetical protein